jgi:hypothetical protein
MPTEFQRKTPVVRSGAFNQVLVIGQGMLMASAIVLAMAIFLNSLPQPLAHLSIKTIAVDASLINDLP